MLRREPVEPALRPRHELDAMAASIELTLISVVQGVALYFLTDAARPIVVAHRVSCLPYLLSGLLIILAFWTRAVIHAVTVIRWPLELGHNFLYVILTLFESVLFTQVGAPENFHPLAAALIAVVLVAFVYERRMYRLRRADSAGPAGLALLDELEREHDLNTRLFMPLTLAGFVAGAVAVGRLPHVFLDEGWHAALGWAQCVGLLAYLGSLTRFYNRIKGRVLDARSEWDPPVTPT